MSANFIGLEIWNQERLMTDDIYHFDYELWRTQSTKITITYIKFLCFYGTVFMDKI